MTKALLAFLVVACMACQDKDMTKPPLAAFSQTDVSYGSDPQQKLDVYLPAGRSSDSSRSIFLIHGGGWSEGDKRDFTAYVTVLQQQLPGYAIFNVNYRLFSPGVNRFPTQEEDIDEAIRFVMENRAEYGISEQVVYLGASAGAHLALLQGYKHTETARPLSVISFFAPTELKSLYTSSPGAGYLLSQLIGTNPTGNAALYDQSSPAFFVNAQSSPTMILQGGADDVVPPSQATLLRDKLDSAGVANQYVFYPTEGHGWSGINLLDSFGRIIAFIRAHE